MDLARIPTSSVSPRPTIGLDRLDLNSSSTPTKSYILCPPEDTGESLFKTADKIQLVDLGIKVKEELTLIGGMLCDLTDKQARELEKKGYRVHLDAQDQYLPPMPWDPKSQEEEEAEELSGKKAEEPKQEPEFQPRAPQLAPRFDTPLTRKFQGEGVGIAILDTGIYPHPDFNTPYNRLVAFADMVNGRSTPYDDHGHGTHVAGDAAGSGLLSGGIYRGPASKAHLVGVKVLGEDGSGKTSDIIKGIQFCIENKDKLGIRVINLSLGHEARKKYQDDPVDQAVQKAYEAGLVVVAAAGNDGPDKKTVKAPGDSPYAITVGAVDDKNTPDPSDDNVTDFSSRGPTKYGAAKPDLSAPGEAIMAPLSPGTGSEAQAARMQVIHNSIAWFSKLPAEEIANVPDQQFQLMGIGPETMGKIRQGGDVAKNEFNRLLRATSRMPLSHNKAYVGMPGTSMATPIVAGVVAGMLEANPDLGPDEVKEILVKSADKLPGNVSKYQQGAGMVDPHEAILMALDRGKPVAADQNALQALLDAMKKAPKAEETKSEEKAPGAEPKQTEEKAPAKAPEAEPKQPEEVDPRDHLPMD